MSTVATPVYRSEDIAKANVYEPSEDSFLLLDALEADLTSVQKLNPSVIVEVGPGSGVIITALAKMFKKSARCFAIDINASACVCTKKMALQNQVHVEVIQADLFAGIGTFGHIDVVFFNPPYVVTPHEEVVSEDMIVRAYAGGDRGREVVDRFLPLLSQRLSEKCIFYLLAIKENDPPDIVRVMLQLGFYGETLISRQVPGEKLCVLKFTRKKRANSTEI